MKLGTGEAHSLRFSMMVRSRDSTDDLILAALLSFELSVFMQDTNKASMTGCDTMPKACNGAVCERQ